MKTALKSNERDRFSGRGYHSLLLQDKNNLCEFVTPNLNSPKKNNKRMSIPPEGHIEHHFPGLTYEKLTTRLEENRDGFHQDNLKLVSQFVRDAKLGKTNANLNISKKKVGLKRLLKYLHDLKKLDAYFNKSFSEITEKDMEAFILDLEEGVIKQKNGSPYAQETQVVIKKLIKKFWKWLKGDNETVPPMVRWIDTSLDLKEYRAISKQQVENILDLMTSNGQEKLLRNRAIISMLFDGGLRADELLNTRIRHLSYEKDTYKVRVEFSKTKPRTITLPYSKKYIDAWLDIHPQRAEPSAKLFPVSYQHLLMIVKRAGDTINVSITPHSLRHSSATYWAHHLPQYLMCSRFGWSMGSKMPQRYIDKEGLSQEEAIKVAKTTHLEELEAKNREMSSRLVMMEEQMNRLFGKDMEEARRIIELVKEQMKIKQ